MVADSGASSHMTRMRDVFLSVSGTNSQCHVTCRVYTIHVMKGFGTVLFQLKSRRSLEVARVMYVLELKMHLLAFLVLEDKGHVVVF